MKRAWFVILNMEDNEKSPYLLRWTFYADGTVKKSRTPHETPSVERRIPKDEPVITPPPKREQLSCKRCGDAIPNLV